MVVPEFIPTESKFLAKIRLMFRTLFLAPGATNPVKTSVEVGLCSDLYSKRTNAVPTAINFGYS
jgi:hypothetical protein